jgi:hypothetical protein
MLTPEVSNEPKAVARLSAYACSGSQKSFGYPQKNDAEATPFTSWCIRGAYRVTRRFFDRVEGGGVVVCRVAACRSDRQGLALAECDTSYASEFVWCCNDGRRHGQIRPGPRVAGKRISSSQGGYLCAEKRLAETG